MQLSLFTTISVHLFVTLPSVSYHLKIIISVNGHKVSAVKYKLTWSGQWRRRHWACSLQTPACTVSDQHR